MKFSSTQPHLFVFIVAYKKLTRFKQFSVYSNVKNKPDKQNIIRRLTNK